MWAIENQTPFAAERTFVRDRDGSEIWLVAVRATFTISPDGTLRVAKEQDPVAQAPKYLGKPGKSSLRCDTDLPRTKPGTDVLINGTAYVPNGKPQTEIEAGFRVGDLQKKLFVSGPTVWEKSMGFTVPGAPNRSLKCRSHMSEHLAARRTRRRHPRCIRILNPIRWVSGLMRRLERHFPVYVIQDHELKSLRRIGLLPVSALVGCSWTPRRKLAGTYDEKWQNERQPLLPDDFSDDHFFSAPQDQQVRGYLRGGEEVELSNMTPKGSMKFLLPKFSFGFRTSIDGGVEHHRGNLHTVLIEPDQHRVIMVWHTALPCHHTLYTLKRTVVFQKTNLAADEQESTAA